MTHHKKMRLTLLQVSPVPCSPLKTFEKLAVTLENIPETDLLVLPEMWMGEFIKEELGSYASETSTVLKELGRFCAKRKIYAIGSHLEIAAGNFYNTASVILPTGRVSKRYRKVHLFRQGFEHHKYSAGNDRVLVQTPWAKGGLEICYDVRFPEFSRALVLSGAQFLVVPAAWPLERIDHYLTLLKARAIENQCFVIGVNQTGKNLKGIVMGGSSAVFGPWGETVGKLGKKAGQLNVTLDFEKLMEVRQKFQVLKMRRPELYLSK